MTDSVKKKSEVYRFIMLAIILVFVIARISPGYIDLIMMAYLVGFFCYFSTFVKNKISVCLLPVVLLLVLVGGTISLITSIVGISKILLLFVFVYLFIKENNNKRILGRNMISFLVPVVVSLANIVVDIGLTPKLYFVFISSCFLFAYITEEEKNIGYWRLIGGGILGIVGILVFLVVKVLGI